MVSPDNISINLVRGDPKQRVNLDLDIELYKDAVKFRDDLFYQKNVRSCQVQRKQTCYGWKSSVEQT